MNKILSVFLLFAFIFPSQVLAQIAPTISYFSLDQKVLEENGRILLSWRSNGKSCEGRNSGWSGKKPASGKEELPLPKSATLYDLYCGSDGVGTIMNFKVWNNPKSIVLTDKNGDMDNKHYIVLKKPKKISISWNINDWAGGIAQCEVRGPQWNGLYKIKDAASITFTKKGVYNFNCVDDSGWSRPRATLNVVFPKFLKRIPEKPLVWQKEKIKGVLSVKQEDMRALPWTGEDVSLDEYDDDSDGLPNEFEYAYGTKTNERDSDGDGYSDREEIISGYSPLSGNKLVVDAVSAKKKKGYLLVERATFSDSVWYMASNGKLYYFGRATDVENVAKNLKLSFGSNFKKKIEDVLASSGEYNPVPLIQKKKLIFSASPSSISKIDEKVMLSWDAHTMNADYCTASGGWDGRKNASGQEEAFGFLVRSFTIRCYAPDGSSETESVSIDTDNVPVSEKGDYPKITLTATPEQINPGQSTTISWTSDATTCSIMEEKDDWIRVSFLPASGSQAVHPKTSGFFTLNCDTYTSSAHYGGGERVYVSVNE